MNPQEKAKELIDKFEKETEHQDSHWDTFEVSKQCAIIAVDEILNLEELIDWDFWSDVKLEIDKL